MNAWAARLRLWPAERRKRVRRPLSLRLLVAGLALLPPANYLVAARHLGAGPQHFAYIWRHMGAVQVGLMVAPCVAAVGLGLVKRWGWYFFLMHCLSVTAFNLYAVVVNPARFNWSALLVTIAAAAGTIYIARRDISAPYFRVYPRGWRYEKRSPVRVPVRVDGVPLETLDTSPAGIFVAWAAAPFVTGAEVTVDFGDGGFPAVVVRKDATGVGIAFRNRQALTPNRAFPPANHQ